MTRNVIWQDHEPTVQPVDETVDHLRGSPAGRLILEYGDYECPYSRQAFRAIERVEQELGGGVRFLLPAFPADRDPPARAGLDIALFDHDRASDVVLERVRRDVDSGIASGKIRGTPTLFIDGVVHRGSYDPATLLRTLTR
jgi:protein-disulfide isomerase